MSEIYAHVLQIYLGRLMQADLHPRQAAWSTQFIVENFTPFNSMAEWDAFNKMPQNGGQNLGKQTPADVGIDTKYVTWAKAVWAKWGRIKTHVINVVNVDFKALLTSDGRLKSGQQTSAVVELLRRKYFDEWCTTTNGVVTHAYRPIEECLDWVPGSWWHSWCRLGPPQGANCVAPFLDVSVQECQQASGRAGDATVSTGPVLPAPINDLLTHQFQGRKEQREAQQRKALLASSKPCGLDFLSPPPKIVTMQKANELKQFEAHLKERDAKMARLDQLLAHDGFSAVQKQNFKQEKMELMLQPIVSLESCCGTPLQAPSTNSSVTVTEDEAQNHRICAVETGTGTIRPRKITDELDFDTCVTAGLAPESVIGSAAKTLGEVHSAAAFTKTSAFHSRVVYDECKKYFQSKKISKQRSSGYFTQKNLHIDAGYDSTFMIENDTYSIFTANDVAEHQPAFFVKFLSDFDIIEQVLPAKESMFEAFVSLVCSRDSLADPFSVESLTVPAMRALISDHIQFHNGVIPGCLFNFEEDRIFIPDFDGDLAQYCQELCTDRCGDQLVLHAFCHKFEFDAVLFSVKEPGGTLFQNSLIAHPADVFSMVLDLNVESDSMQSDRYSLAMPKGGGTKNDCSSFLNCERCPVADAEETLELAAKELHLLRGNIVKDEQSVRFRSHAVNQKIRDENKAKLAASQAAYDAAKDALDAVKSSQFCERFEASDLEQPVATTTPLSVGSAVKTAWRVNGDGTPVTPLVPLFAAPSPKPVASHLLSTLSVPAASVSSITLPVATPAASVSSITLPVATPAASVSSITLPVATPLDKAAEAMHAYHAIHVARWKEVFADRVPPTTLSLATATSPLSSVPAASFSPVSSPVLLYDSSAKAKKNGKNAKPVARAASPGDYSEFSSLFEKLPLWNVDLEVFLVDAEIGRGIRVLRKFKKGDILGMYDGHRCDATGNIKIRLQSVCDILKEFPQLNREINKALSFQPSHSVSVMRTHLSGLYVDGGPLCDPILDKLINSWGRFALANSASGPMNANMRPIWVRSPNLPRDYINNLADLECFFEATCDIEAYEELLWTYPLDHHMNQQPPPAPRLPLKRAPSPAHHCDHFTTCTPGKCSDCKCAKCIVNQVSGQRIRKIKKTASS